MSEYIANLRKKIGHEMIMLPSVAALIRDEFGKILAQRRSDNGKWALPGGAIDLGETPSQAVVREVWEETGLHVVPEYLQGVFGGTGYRVAYRYGDHVEYTCLVFECKTIGGTLTPVDGESVELSYFAPEDLPDLGFHIRGRSFATNLNGRSGYDSAIYENG